MGASRRYVRGLALSLCMAAAAAVCGSCAGHQPSSHASYCAMMPDTVGLYVGNPVTQMGYPIGKVAAVTPSDTDVRVDFTVDDDRRLPVDVKAIIRSTSILADRSLELVGNYNAGAQLGVGECIALANSTTPKSLSEVIGSATNFVNSINPSGSNNVGGVVRGLDEATRNTGPRINQLLTRSSQVLDSPDQAIGDVGSIVSNLAQLTSTVADVSGPLKEALLAAQQTTPDVVTSLTGSYNIIHTTVLFIGLVSDLERDLGGETQQTLDSLATAIRKASQHAPWIANLLNPVPWWINTLANHVNNRQFSIRYRPPLYRIRTPDGLLQCGMMNAAAPGSCSDVAGMPYSIDADLLRYIMMQASR
jgi:phospholipid/cholesterol/gamma-HCH transport system substrate-binding protein